MRIVIDTNVFVSAALKDKSVPAMAVRLAMQHGVLLKSAATEQQLFDVLARPYLARLVSTMTLTWMKAVMEKAEPIIIPEQIKACRDPTDDRFLELAVSGKADFIVTGDADLLVLDPFRKIPIIQPSRFISLAPGW